MTPYVISTKMSNFRDNCLIPSADSYVRESLRHFTIRTVTSGCILHDFMVCIFFQDEITTVQKLYTVEIDYNYEKLSGCDFKF